MATPPLIALDLGSTKIGCVIALPSDEAPGYHVVGHSLTPYSGALPTWPQDPLAVGRTIEQALAATGFGGELIDAHVALSHPALHSETIQAAITLADEPISVRRQDLDRLARVALTQALGVDRDALVMERLGCSGNGFDDVRDPRGLPATRLVGRFRIVTVPSAVRRAAIQAVECAGLDVARLTYSLIADAAGSEANPETGRLLLVDIGGLNTDLGLFVEGVLEASQTIPWGGTVLATALARTMRVTQEQAERLSLEGLGSHRDEVREHVNAGLTQLQEALETLLAGQPLPDRAICAGRGCLIDGVVEWVERTTGVNTTLGRTPRLQGMGDLADQVGLTTAMGLLEVACATTARAAGPPVGLAARVIERTKFLLAEYF